MCFSDIVYGIIYMYITKYGCVFLKTLAKVYTWQCIPILLGSLPLAHNAQHSLVIYNGRSRKNYCSVSLKKIDVETFRN